MKKLIHVLLFLSGFIMAGCGTSVPTDFPPHDEKRAVYYWKTILDLDNPALEWLECHKVERIYLRMFDVVANRETTAAEWPAVPNASMRVEDSRYYQNNHDSIFYHFDIVPVVYITQDAMHASDKSIGDLARNIVDRTAHMLSYNNLPPAKEIQLDCDWTASTRDAFYELCRAVRQHADTTGRGWAVSSTIRLHQLSQTPPPVDRGVLMVYNTGSFRNRDGRNSILHIDDVRPYVDKLDEYNLHLDVAYPTYKWQLVYRGNEFKGLTDGMDVKDAALFLPIGNNYYRARRDVLTDRILIRRGDVIKMEECKAQDVIAVKQLIEEHMSRRPHSNIIYHLDLENLSQYAYNEIEKIF